MYWVQVYGPNITGKVGSSDGYTIEQIHKVRDINGLLEIITASREAGVTTAGTPLPARGPETVIYARGEWTKIRIGKIKQEES